MNKEVLRKRAVIGFLALGIILAVVDMNKPEPRTVSGVGEGYNGDVKVVLKVKEKGSEIKIIGVDVDHEDTPPIANPALETLKAQTIQAQNPEEIDMVSGATYTSEGYVEGLKAAHKAAKESLGK